MKSCLLCATLAILLSSCGGPAVTAEPGTPSHAMQVLMKAIQDEDVETYLSVMDEQARAMAVKSREFDREQFDRLMDGKFDSMRLQWRGLTVSGEKINGDTAVVTLSGRGDSVNVDMVKEPDGWKIKLMK